MRSPLVALLTLLLFATIPVAARAAPAVKLVIPACGVWPPPTEGGGCAAGQAIIPLGQPVTFEVVAVDANDMPATGYTGTVEFASTDPLAILPPARAYTLDDASRLTFQVTFFSLGEYWNQQVSVIDSANGFAASKSFPLMLDRIFGGEFD